MARLEKAIWLTFRHPVEAYPEAAKQANDKQVVILQVDIDATGAVKRWTSSRAWVTVGTDRPSRL